MFPAQTFRIIYPAMLLLLSCFSRVQLCATPETAAHQVPSPWDSPGKNTGVGCHFLLQCMKVKVKSLSCVRFLATPWTATYQAPLSMGFSRQEYWNGLPLPSPYPAIGEHILLAQLFVNYAKICHLLGNFIFLSFPILLKNREKK